MILKNEWPAVTGEHELVITRLLDAPPALAFQVWSDPAHVARWWGPRERGEDFTTPVCEMDFQVGGSYRICIRSPAGRELWQRGRYLEIIAPERLVFTFAWDNLPDMGWETLVTVIFAAHGPSQTQMTFTQIGLPSVAERDGHIQGWTQCVDRLATYLATQTV